MPPPTWQVHAGAAAEAALAAMRERQVALEALLACEMKLLEAVFPRQVGWEWLGAGALSGRGGKRAYRQEKS